MFYPINLGRIVDWTAEQRLALGAVGVAKFAAIFVPPGETRFQAAVDITSGQAASRRAAKRERRVWAVGVALCHSAILTKLMAAAVMACWRRVLASPI